MDDEDRFSRSGLTLAVYLQLALESIVSAMKVQNGWRSSETGTKEPDDDVQRQLLSNIYPCFVHFPSPPSTRLFCFSLPFQFFLHSSERNKRREKVKRGRHDDEEIEQIKEKVKR